MKARQAKRLARTGLSISLLVLIGAGFSTISSASDKSNSAISNSESKYVQVVVTPGESLWSIAAMVAGNSQIQSVVADIVEVNKLKSADVPAGTRLLVPTF
ncbi:peptidoglycan-binding protein [Candidatus Nanopelagicus abundans]|uniref:Peptidoglycan-binding protein n=1 Tax=Candidatus Nanopelagicus abundans TaxID=1884916 RepID=A0A249L3Q6_9ACTN|nr:LysM peptidoglycan-binding domain-containing protein [Candidatus Nanopelagicus abundans]ASY23720.1 peptidoglycan-binding protein [Candidatus Nanopelagicus abundans]